MKISKSGFKEKYFPDANNADINDFLTIHKRSLHNINSDLLSSIIKVRPVTGHKGSFGHTLLIAGSKGKTGAAILSSMATLRSGCGLLTALIPSEAEVSLLCKLPEAMTRIRKRNDLTVEELAGFNSIGFGPGAGTGKESAELLYFLLNNYKGPLVIDADGLTILSRNKDHYPLLNSNIILTPHPVEFDRMTHNHDTALNRLITQINFSRKFKVTILLKGHRSTIVTKDGIYFNTTGNNGMATAGSGDVLTGIISSLCAQGYKTEEAAIAGAFIHGYSGDLAARKHSKHSMLASDLIYELGTCFKKFEK